MMADWPEIGLAAVSLLADAIHSLIGAIRVMWLDVRPMRESEQESQE